MLNVITLALCQIYRKYVDDSCLIFNHKDDSVKFYVTRTTYSVKNKNTDSVFKYCKCKIF